MQHFKRFLDLLPIHNNKQHKEHNPNIKHKWANYWGKEKNHNSQYTKHNYKKRMKEDYIALATITKSTIQQLQLAQGQQPKLNFVFEVLVTLTFLKKDLFVWAWPDTPLQDSIKIFILGIGVFTSRKPIAQKL